MHAIISLFALQKSIIEGDGEREIPTVCSFNFVFVVTYIVVVVV